MEITPSLEFKDWVSVATDIILALSALLTVGLGFYGLKKWMHEHKGKEAFSLIKELIKESHKMNRACSILRERVRNSERRFFSHSERQNFTSSEVWKITEKEVFDKRFEAFISADSSYRDALLDARAVLGSKIYSAFLGFGGYITKNVDSVNSYLDQVLVETFVYISDEDPALVEVQEKFLISPINRASDQLTVQTMDAREEGEKALLSYIGRKSIRG